MQLHGDRDHFEFVIRNLASNAIKFSQPGGAVEIRAGKSLGGASIMFAVSDQGKGISKLQQEQFLKSNIDISYGTRGEKGTGIGLMLTKEFINANGGRIWLASEEGKVQPFISVFRSIDDDRLLFSVKIGSPSRKFHHSAATLRVYHLVTGSLAAAGSAWGRSRFFYGRIAGSA